MRRAFLIGQGPTTESALDSLLGRFEVVGLARSEGDAVAVAAGDRGVPVLRDTSVGAVEAAVCELQPDCVVVSSYDRILPASLLERCPFVNVHYAPLPE
jgi:methionyl-tRNA formyltransferase